MACAHKNCKEYLNLVTHYCYCYSDYSQDVFHVTRTNKNNKTFSDATGHDNKLFTDWLGRQRFMLIFH